MIALFTCCNERLMQNMTPIPGERMFANDVIKNNVNNDIVNPHCYDTLYAGRRYRNNASALSSTS